jgi:hypothetical protein
VRLIDLLEHGLALRDCPWSEAQKSDSCQNPRADGQGFPQINRDIGNGADYTGDQKNGVQRFGLVTLEQMLQD